MLAGLVVGLVSAHLLYNVVVHGANIDRAARIMRLVAGGVVFAGPLAGCGLASFLNGSSVVLAWVGYAAGTAATFVPMWLHLHRCDLTLQENVRKLEESRQAIFDSLAERLTKESNVEQLEKGLRLLDRIESKCAGGLWKRFARDVIVSIVILGVLLALLSWNAL